MHKVNVTISDGEKANDIVEYLAGFDAATSLRQPEYTAHWLSGHAHDIKWNLRTERTFEDSEGNVKHVWSIFWDFRLCDNTLLTDEINNEIREFFQEITFCLRDNPHVNGTNSNLSLFTGMVSLRCFFSWVFSPDLGLEPRKFFLSRLTTSHVQRFVDEFVSGGVFGVLKVGNKILDLITEATGKYFKAENVYSLTQTDKSFVIGFLDELDCYTINNYGKRALCRSRIAKLFDLSKSERYGKRFTYFLRQFEPEITDSYPSILIPATLRTEYPSHKTILLSDINNVIDSSLASKTLPHHYIASFAKMKSLFPRKVPPSTIKLSELRLPKDFQRTGTPWIPLKISLHLLNQAIGFILAHAEKIINAIDILLTELNKASNGKIVYWSNENKRKEREALIKRVSLKARLPFERVIQNHRLPDGTQVWQRDYDFFRRAPCLHDLHIMLWAACTIVLTTLKPLRIDELLGLEYGCLKFRENEGYWLKQKVAKSSTQDKRVTRRYPIPTFAAKAVTYLQRLNELSRKYTFNGQTAENRFLFFKIANLWVHKENSNASNLKQDDIRDALALFCDYINLPLDSYGRRWYVNIHELRKSFLLTFFWTFKYSSLDACRWIAGHSDPNHILAYIQGNIPGEEMVEVEAQYAQQQLRLYATNQKLTELENLESLNRDVCDHFSVKSVSTLSEEDLHEWIEHALSTGRYRITAYGIEEETAKFSARVAIKICQAKTV